MSSERMLKITNLLLAIVLLGEALALLFGRLFFIPGGTDWLTIANITLLSLDLAMGVSLLLLFVLTFKLDKKTILLLLFFILATIVGSHIYRNIDFAINSSTAFAFNFPLLIVNNLKLIASLYSIGLVSYSLLFWEQEAILTINDLD
ncbi:MAG: hypothetical protein GF308_02480 [Candidatus Heimdallarchaeota archaeon]|nr:hypothetical protein [Candidatus Heimdallarchaeota archaeon]